MNSWRRALRFIAAQQRGAKNVQGIERRAVRLALGKERINADVYTCSSAEAPTMVILHGMSPLVGHSQAAVSLRLLGDIWGDVWRLVAGFAWFFRKAAE